MAKSSKSKPAERREPLAVADLPESDYSEAEIARRRDEGLRRLLRTPPKPHAEISREKCSRQKTG